MTLQRRISTRMHWYASPEVIQMRIVLWQAREKLNTSSPSSFSEKFTAMVLERN